MVTRKIKLSELPPRQALEQKLIDLMNNLKVGRPSTRFDLALLAHIVAGSNFTKDNVRKLQESYDLMLLELDIDKPGRFSEDLTRLAKAGMRSLKEQVASFWPDSESDLVGQTVRNSNPSQDNPFRDEDGNGADHAHVPIDGSGSSAPADGPRSAEEEVRARSE